MSAYEILSAYRKRLITASEAIEQAGVESIEALYDAVAELAENAADQPPELHFARAGALASRG